jgi:hypothetical protein
MERRIRRLRLPIVLATLVAAILPATVAAADFPRGWEGFHTYAEMRDDVAAVAAAHPTIVQRFSIGKSYEGRDLWAAKISDNVATDEDEPEVLFDGLHHADEHMSLEMTLKILHWLADGYGTNARITRLVDSREIWIVFAVNPDGAEYDIKYAKFHHWRKNRQPNAGSPYLGTDLNRNYNYRWGGGGRTSGNPQAITYHGPYAFSAPETRAMRTFFLSRVIDGTQQIRAHITFHETGRLVMWPYGYTYADVPADMTRDDHTALAKLGRAMAATNGYRPQQASDLYITSGTTRDYLYGIWRVFSYTFEMSVRDYAGDELIASETGRNKEAVLMLIDRAWCPLSIIGSATRIDRCGAFDDDLEIRKGAWTTNPDGTDTAPASAAFVRADPAGTRLGSVPLQLASTASGSKAYVTGAPAGSTPGTYDLDGRSTIRSGPIDVPNTVGQRLAFRWTFAHDAGASSADSLVALVERANGSTTQVWSRLGAPVVAKGGWRYATVSLDAWAGETIRIRFVATDGGANNTIEAGIDDIRVTLPG